MNTPFDTLGPLAKEDVEASALRQFKLGGLQFPAAPEFREDAQLDAPSQHETQCDAQTLDDAQ